MKPIKYVIEDFRGGTGHFGTREQGRLYLKGEEACWDN
jgi:hypothetical protein